MLVNYWSTFSQLITTSFGSAELIFGIVPLYFALIASELTPSKASYRTAVQTGFSFVWAATQWLYPYFRSHGSYELQKTGLPIYLQGPQIEFDSIARVNLVVTLLVLALGLIALYSGFRQKFPKYFKFLGYTRFANYFMIMLFPIQKHALPPPHNSWTWDRLVAIVLFAVPIWLVLHFGLMPFRKGGKTKGKR